ncbi:MAG TPA: hypothetical protein VMU51_38820 [Mycobacteriales bacterium]|nr:hypothetical protein [Mycobacteriales bacterium]
MPPTTDLTPSVPVDSIEALIAELEAQTEREVPLSDITDPWPSEICTGRFTCVPR